MLIPRKRLEDKLVAALNQEVLEADVLELVFERTAAKVREHFKYVPEELRLKKLELSRAAQTSASSAGAGGSGSGAAAGGGATAAHAPMVAPTAVPRRRRGKVAMALWDWRGARWRAPRGRCRRRRGMPLRLGGATPRPPRGLTLGCGARRQAAAPPPRPQWRFCLRPSWPSSRATGSESAKPAARQRTTGGRAFLAHGSA
ncbi:MAG: hypothetical protein WKG00_23055 [Polyangiaceae bacterium]